MINPTKETLELTKQALQNPEHALKLGKGLEHILCYESLKQDGMRLIVTHAENQLHRLSRVI